MISAPSTPDDRADNPPGNLPRQLTSFIGRKHEIAEVTELSANARLVTLTGAGGCGKTRLSLEVGSALAADSAFDDGVWWVALAPLDDPELVPQTVATALAIPEEPGRGLTDTLADALEGKRLLLILDNCEHVAEACAELADTLLRACGKLHLLATSRVVLDVAGEHVWPVPPLTVPVVGQPGADDDLGGPEAVRLFVQRARAARSTFAIDDRNAGAVWDVCRRLDGIPLAIELAAVRVRGLSVSQIANHLDDSLALLTRGARAAVPHHQTLRAAIEWSHDLLDDREQALLRRLSVFAGGFFLDAAEAVCADTDDDGEDAAISSGYVLDLLAELADKSLVIAGQPSEGPARYRMLETIRQYAAEKLEESGERGTVRDQHLEFYVARAKEAETQLLGSEMAECLDRLEAEHDNLRAAIRWASTDAARAEKGLNLAAAIWRFWLVRGHLEEGRRYLGGLLEAGSDASGRTRAAALNAVGLMVFYQGDVEAARSNIGDAVAICQDLGEDRMAGLLLGNLGMCDMRLAQYESARGHYEGSLEVLRRLGDDRGVASALCNLGLTALSEGDPDQAQAHYEQSLSLMRKLEDTWGIASVILNLGEVAAQQSRSDAAIGHYRKSLAMFRELDDERMAAHVVNNLAQALALRGDFSESTALLEESLATNREVGDKEQTATSLLRLGRVARLQGDIERASTFCTESAVLHQALGNAMRSCESLMEAAALFACWTRVPAGGASPDVAQVGRAHAERAARLFAAADATRAEFGFAIPADLMPDFERAMAGVRSYLGDEAHDAAWSEGESLSLEDAFALATSEMAIADLAQLDELLRARKLTPRQSLKEKFGGLTAREREVAAVMAQGLTNEEIAEKLMVTVKTVEGHITNILSKLGFENRAQVAAWAVDKGLAEAPEDLDTLLREM